MRVVGKLLSLKRNKTIINGALFSIFSFFGQGVSFVLLIILAKYILPEEYGYLSLFTTITSILSIIFGLGTSGYNGTIFFKESRTSFNKYFTAVFLLNIFAIIPYSLILLICGSFLSEMLSLQLNVLYMAGFLVIFNKCFCFHQELYRLHENLKMYGILSCSNAIMNFITALFFVVYLQLNWVGRIYSLITYSAIYAIIACIYFQKNHYIDFSGLKQRVLPVLKWGLPLVPHLAANWIKNGLDRYIINDCHGTYEVGIFSFALNLTSVIIAIGVAFNNSNSVTLFQLLSSDMPFENKIKDINKSTKEFLWIYVVISTIIILLGSIFTPLLFSNYKSSVPFFIILGIYGFLQCVYFLYCNFFFYFGMTKQLMFITFISAILHLSLSIIFTRFSLYLTAMIYLISMGVVDYLVISRARKMLSQINLFK